MVLEVNGTANHNSQLPPGFRIYRVRVVRRSLPVLACRVLCSWTDDLGILLTNRFSRPTLFEDEGLHPDTERIRDHGYYRVCFAGSSPRFLLFRGSTASTA